VVSNGQYQARPEAIRSTVGNVGGILMQATNTVLELESLVVQPTSFATIGSAVGAANSTMQNHQSTALRQLLQLLQTVNSLVKLVADNYQHADSQVAAGYGGGVPTVGAGNGSSIFSSPAAGTLAVLATGDGNATLATPHAADSVLGYLGAAGLYQGSGVPTGSAAELAGWLAASSSHQAQVGVVGVYAGAARGFGDIPGGLRPGDLVSITPSGGESLIGVVGGNGQLYNHGLLAPDFGPVAQVQVYRPAPTAGGAV
jgi:uncharacterized protein YukE